MIRRLKYYQEISESYRFLTQFLFESIKMEQLIEVSDRIVERKPNLRKLTRSERRKKAHLIQWFDNNWEMIEDLVCQITPVDKSGNFYYSFNPTKFLWKFRDEISYDFLDDLASHHEGVPSI